MRAAASEARPLLRRRGVAGADEEDLIAEIQLDALRYLRSEKNRPRNLSAFLHYRARAALSRHWRRRGRISAARRSVEEERVELGDLSDRLHEKGLIDAHQRCVATMPARVQVVYRMLVEEHLRQAEIARALQKSEVWVRRRVCEARSIALRSLRRDGYLRG